MMGIPITLNLFESAEIFSSGVKIPELAAKVKEGRVMRNKIMHAESRLDATSATEIIKIAIVLVFGIYNHVRMQPLSRQEAGRK